MSFGASLQRAHKNTPFWVEGPRPVRDSTWPRGRRDLTSSEARAVAETNTLADYAIEALALAEATGKLCFLEFPKGVGRTRRGTPDWLWRDPAMKKLANTSLVRGAIYQNEWPLYNSGSQPACLPTSRALLQTLSSTQSGPSSAQRATTLGYCPSAKTKELDSLARRPAVLLSQGLPQLTQQRCL